jgi:CheY-like chemotaxis protein
MRILHVEDDEDTRTLVACILHGAGGKLSPWKTLLQRSSSLGQAGSTFTSSTTGLKGDTDNALCRSLRSLDPHTPILFYSGAVFPSDVRVRTRVRRTGLP